MIKKYHKINGVIYKVMLLLIIIMSIVKSQQYVVCYIFSNGLQQRIPNNQIYIYQKSRFDSYVMMNSQTRQKYANLDILKNISQLNSQTLLSPQFQGNIHYEKSTLPQNIWIDQKQIIIVQVDVSLFPQNKQQLQKYQTLFVHKGTSIFMINTNDPNQNVPDNILHTFDYLIANKQNICRIDVRANSLDQNTQIIKECYSRSPKKIVPGKVNVDLLALIQKYWAIGLIYLFMCSIIACFSPFLMIWWHKKQVKNTSHV